MPTIQALIRQEINPFDRINLKPGNFWAEASNTALMVESIHRQELQAVETMLEQVIQDQRSRTILLLGDSGSGKSYLLGRLKQSLNTKAFFAYIGPWADSDYIWRHTLRYTVDSLMQIPANQQASQLLLWLQNLSAFTKRTKKQRVFDHSVWELLQSDRKSFIQHLKKTYRTANLYHPDIFFGVLHDLTNPNLYALAGEWLRGDDLSEESMQRLKLKHSIDSEEAAKGILANFGRISTATQPIVLCFDQLDNIPRTLEGMPDFQALFNINTTIHNEPLKNFLVIISVVTNTWNQAVNRIQKSDRDRLDLQLRLKQINLTQAEALWIYHLSALHQAAAPKPASPLFPLTRQQLEAYYPGGKTTPRSALTQARKDYQAYKQKLLEAEWLPRESANKPSTTKSAGKSITSQSAPSSPSPPSDATAEFQLLWQQELRKIQTNLTKITLRSAPELIQMLSEVLTLLEVPQIQLKILPGKFGSYSLGYTPAGSTQPIGLIWTEDSSMNSFFSVMNACQKLIAQSSLNPSLHLRLIRAGNVGRPSLAGNQIYRELFTGNPHRHLRPALASVQQLATYHSLVNSALAQELVIGGRAISLKELEALTRQTQVMQTCQLLIDLELITAPAQSPASDSLANNQAIKEYIHSLILTQQFMGRQVLTDRTLEQFSMIDIARINELIDQLCQEQKIRIVNPQVKLSDQTLCIDSQT